MGRAVIFTATQAALSAAAPRVLHAARSDCDFGRPGKKYDRGLVRAPPVGSSSAQARLSRTAERLAATTLAGAEARAALCTGGQLPPALRLGVQGSVTAGAREFEVRSAEDS